MNKKAILIADLGYGDAGKGSIVDFLARDGGAHTVIRYNGGAQAAHNVITPDGKHHTFAQFGSATFLPNVRTHLSRFMIVHPLAMLAEERDLQSMGITDAFERVTVERGALIITPFQQAANRIKEIARGDGMHGSCGLGIGETMSDWLSYGDEVLLAGDLTDRSTIIHKLRFLREQKLAQLQTFLTTFPANPRAQEELKIFSDPGLLPAVVDTYRHWADQIRLVDRDYLRQTFNGGGAFIFEGAQGVLLDEWWGFFPYNSWSTLTFKNADTLLHESQWEGETCRLGLTRAYMTRHGAGTMVTEDEQMSIRLPEPHNPNNPWQHAFRVGPLDLPALRYALNVTGNIDGLVVTHLDRLLTLPEWQICDAYLPGKDEKRTFLDDGGGNIRIPTDPTNLAEQEQLTHFLQRCKPLLETVDKDANKFLNLMEEKLGHPVMLTSAGMTANEKDWRVMPH